MKRLVWAICAALALSGSHARAEIGVEPPESYAALVASIDGFWRRAFPQRFKTAYRSPRVVFRDPKTDPEIAHDGLAGFYEKFSQELHVDLSDNYIFTAHVLAHEFGHHVQFLAKLNAQLSPSHTTAPTKVLGELLMRFELQADCFSGVWAHHAAKSGAVFSAEMAIAIGRGEAEGEDSKTHGTAAQRSRWFLRGYRSGAVDNCDSFPIAFEDL